jgi:hypothetical protein
MAVTLRWADETGALECELYNSATTTAPRVIAATCLLTHVSLRRLPHRTLKLVVGRDELECEVPTTGFDGAVER